MSASTIARWNAIPLERQPEHPNAQKRPRPDDEDDDVSIASRSPSPRPDAMDVDSGLGYHEYPSGPAHEEVTVETKIKPTNVGFAMLRKLGWSEGQPLGLQEDGEVDPIPFNLKQDLTGVGKISQDVRMIETTVSQRRELTSERMRKETVEERESRENSIAKRTAVQMEIAETLKAFYCALCDKQFKNVAQYDEHTNSYAHHHKARAKDLQASVRMQAADEVERRKEKERRREEKELRKLAKAQGIKMAKPAVAPAVVASAPGQPSVAEPAGHAPMDTTPAEGGFKAAGWATVAPSNPPPAQGFKKGGWATVGGDPSPAQGPSTTSSAAAHPAFRAGGQIAASGDVTPSPQPLPTARGGWAQVSIAPHQPMDMTPSVVPPAVAAPAPTPTKAKQAASIQAESKSAASRNSWQSFKAGRGRR
ncbi:uncharacterized protein SCHCODRAFT_01205988 [Schizophyllum commune H4-8]|nr:uncharacterized protein SCHCODRAFT_01205988 [Schizophyllum commune H4-8]KAI5898665.1 hypothetical protein SCHCODRAFT_01205988 [Schizophyllum commune H4-8]